MTPVEQITVPAQDSVRTHDQLQPTQRPARQRAEQRREQRPISRLEADPLTAQLPLQDPDLMTQRITPNFL
ncbi:hypothetical protein GCM10009838_01300 [Catenulispora subtropica]|uniref:Uncharacterized protein n=1 Tax=Catenulispora subtropica TaxID=450798 RepID=A0ABN2QD41_9ACTN